MNLEKCAEFSLSGIIPSTPGLALSYDLGVLHRARKASNGRVTPRGTSVKLSNEYNARKK